MSEREHARTRVRLPDSGRAIRGLELAPGRINPASRMTAPANPTMSGIVMRKAVSGGGK